MKKLLLIISVFMIIFLLSCTGTSTTTTTELVTTQTMADYVSSLSNDFNIGLFVTEDLTTSIGINFELADNTNGYVEYAIQGSDDFQELKAGRKIRSFDDKEVYLYEVTLTGLVSGTTYQYRVRNEDWTEVSEYHTFTTLYDSQDEYTMMYLADPQENAETGYMAYAYGILSVLEFSQQNYQLVMTPGDTVNDRDIRSQWNMFYQYSSIFSYSIPMAVALGNHEMPYISDAKVSSMEFDGYYNLPNNGPTYGEFDQLEGDLRPSNFDLGKTYSFDYGFAHITVIDTEVYCDGTTTCATYDTDNAAILNQWVEDDLAASTKEWNIVMLHRGPYSLSYDTVNVRTNLVPIFEEYGVDLVLAGHDHQYSRAVYLDGGMVAFARADDTYLYGTMSLIPSDSANLDFNSYSSSVGVTYLTPNTTATKFYGGSKSSGIQVNYAFVEEFPVIPMITVTEDEIRVISYAVEKDSALSIVPSGVFILEEFTITQ